LLLQILACADRKIGDAGLRAHVRRAAARAPKFDSMSSNS
jgi:hypothetical protein